jgi:hypothetical protein
MSARYFICHSFEPPATVSDNMGDMVGMVIDVKGNTEVEFFVPYLSKQHSLAVPDIALALSAYGGSGYITIYRITNIQSSNHEADPPIQIAVFSAAGEDMRFFRRQGFTNTIRNYFHASKPAAVGQSDPIFDFKRPFQGLNPAAFAPEARYLCGEDYGTLREFCHRPQMLNYVSTDKTLAIRPQVWPAATGTHTGYGYIDYLCHMFRFWRGSMRTSLQTIPGTGIIAYGLPLIDVGVSTIVTAGDYVANGAIYPDGNAPMITSAELPWYWSEPIRPIQNSADGWFNPATQTNFAAHSGTIGTTVLQTYSVGEDFQVGTFQPPLYYTLPAAQSLPSRNAAKALAQNKTSLITAPTVESSSTHHPLTQTSDD